MQGFDPTGTARTGYGKSYEIAPNLFPVIDIPSPLPILAVPQVAEKIRLRNTNRDELSRAASFLCAR